MVLAAANLGKPRFAYEVQAMAQGPQVHETPRLSGDEHGTPNAHTKTFAYVKRNT